MSCDAAVAETAGGSTRTNSSGRDLYFHAVYSNLTGLGAGPRRRTTTIEVTALGTYFAEGVELIESKDSNMLEGADLLLHLFDNQNLRGRVLRADPVHALVQIDGRTWWLDRQSRGRVGRWVVREHVTLQTRPL